jgi:hypothetical protein
MTSEQVHRCAAEALRKRLEICQGNVHGPLLDIADVSFGHSTELPQLFLRVASRIAKPFHVVGQPPSNFTTGLSISLSHTWPLLSATDGISYTTAINVMRQWLRPPVAFARS